MSRFVLNAVGLQLGIWIRALRKLDGEGRSTPTPPGILRQLHQKHVFPSILPSSTREADWNQIKPIRNIACPLVAWGGQVRPSLDHGKVPSEPPRSCLPELLARRVGPWTRERHWPRLSAAVATLRLNWAQRQERKEVQRHPRLW